MTSHRGRSSVKHQLLIKRESSPRETPMDRGSFLSASPSGSSNAAISRTGCRPQSPPTATLHPQPQPRWLVAGHRRISGGVPSSTNAFPLGNGAIMPSFPILPTTSCRNFRTCSDASEGLDLAASNAGMPNPGAEFALERRRPSTIRENRDVRPCRSEEQ